MKSYLSIGGEKVTASLSLWREWIEIASSHVSKCNFASLSLWREWIEIMWYHEDCYDEASLSLWREWIEIVRMTKELKKAMVSLFMERVD